jgi:hypothetical protein
VNYEYNVAEATEYLSTGGLGEVIGLTDIARNSLQGKVQVDTDMAMALCLLADEALKARKVAA